jgi:hypothetical protein
MSMGNVPNSRPEWTLIDLLLVVTWAAVPALLLIQGGAARHSLAENEIVEGYTFKSTDRMKSVRVVKPLPKGQHKFDLVVQNQKFTLEAGKPFWFHDQFPGGVDTFVIKGISPSELLDPDNKLAFPTGISWMDQKSHEIEMVPILYKPPWWRSPLLMWIGIVCAVALGGGGLFLWWRKSQAI